MQYVAYIGWLLKIMKMHPLEYEMSMSSPLQISAQAYFVVPMLEGLNAVPPGSVKSPLNNEGGQQFFRVFKSVSRMLVIADVHLSSQPVSIRLDFGTLEQGGFRRNTL